MSNSNTTGNRNEEDSSTVASIVSKTFHTDISNSNSSDNNLAKLDREISDFITQHHRHPDTEFQLTSALAGNLYIVTVVIRSPQAMETADQKGAGLA